MGAVAAQRSGLDCPRIKARSGEIHMTMVKGAARCHGLSYHENEFSDVKVRQIILTSPEGINVEIAFRGE